MLTKTEIAQLLSDQTITFDGHIQPLIEADVWNDESGDGYKPLDRWMDRLYRPTSYRWAA